MSVDTDDRLSLAVVAVSVATEQPSRVLREAEDILDQKDDDEAAAVALRARGLARRKTGDLSGAIDDLTRSARVADAAALPTRLGEARMSLVVTLADAGRTVEALAEAERAGPLLSGPDRDRLEVQRALVLQRLGRYDEALARYREAVPALRRRADVVWEARALVNRGPLHAYRGDIASATKDLRRAVDLADRNDLRVHGAFARHNLGFTHAQSGDTVLALQLLDRALVEMEELGLDTASVRLDRAETLLAAGLGAEAAEAAADAHESMRELGLAFDAAEARLLLARAALSSGRPAAAQHAAGLAADEFRRQRRPGWHRLARQVVVQARWDAGERGPALTRAARRAADDCDLAGWRTAAIETRFTAARCALASGSTRLARRLLAEVGAERRHPRAEARATAWHAEALLRLTRGDQAGAARALRRGLAVLLTNATALGATDLRAHAAVFGEEMAALGTRLALDTGRARPVLAWAEQSRAGALHVRPVRPPGDGRLADDLARLRAVTAAIRTRAMAGHGTRDLDAERTRLERAVRDRARHAEGASTSTLSVSLHDLPRDLGDRALLEIVRCGDDLVAVTMVDGRSRLSRLAGYDDVTTETEALRFALARVAAPTGSARAGALARSGRDVAAGRLDELLMAPVRAVLADRPLVVVPTGDLHALPWATLPSLRGRPVTVAPSARLWQRAARPRPAGRRRGGVALVAGPRLEHAEAEAEALAGCYPAARVLRGAAATADAVREALDGARLAHVAAHGHFRADNPLFSCLEMADGPLTVYDLERLRRAPEILVLSACDSGLSDVRPGDELMGLAAAVMSTGTRTLVASVVPVADEPTRPFMEAFHRRLRSGQAPSAALATTTAETGLDGFVCLGAG